MRNIARDVRDGLLHYWELAARQSSQDTMEKFAILVGPSGSTFVQVYSFFVSQGGLTEKWGRAWKIIEADGLNHARMIAIQQPGAMAGLFDPKTGLPK